jgi:hypothetical protein
MKETTMNKTLLALAAATSITVSLLAPPPAEARGGVVLSVSASLLVW